VQSVSYVLGLCVAHHSWGYGLCNTPNPFAKLSLEPKEKKDKILSYPPNHNSHTFFSWDFLVELDHSLEKRNRNCLSLGLDNGLVDGKA